MRGDMETLYERFKLIAELTADRWDALTTLQVRELKEASIKALAIVERRDWKERDK